MKTKSFAIALMGLAVVLAMAVCTPLAGCSGCSVDRGSAAIEKSADSKSTKKKEAGQTKSQKAKVSAASASAKADQESASDATDTKADSDESKSSAPIQTGPSKASADKPTESNGDGSKPTEPQKKWVPEQGHWETDYGQAWVPDILYTRHESCICNACGATFNSKSSFYAHSDSMWAQGQDHGSFVDDSYTTTKDQGHCEQQATGQHWVVDIVGHWE